MRLFTLSLLALGFCLTLSAQGRWSFGVDAQVGFSGRTNPVANYENSIGGTRFISDRENRLSPASGAGLWVQFQLTPGLGLRSGVGYLNSGNKDASRSYSEVLATGQKTLTYAERFQFRAHQLQVPLELTLRPVTGQLRPFLSLGIQLNQEWRGGIYHHTAYSSASGFSNYWDESNSSLDQSPSAYLQPIASIGLSINDQMTIRLRQTWAKQNNISWDEHYDFININDPNLPFVFCGVGNIYSTETTHQRLTSLQLVYRIF